MAGVVGRGACEAIMAAVGSILVVVSIEAVKPPNLYTAWSVTLRSVRVFLNLFYRVSVSVSGCGVSLQFLCGPWVLWRHDRGVRESVDCLVCCVALCWHFELDLCMCISVEGEHCFSDLLFLINHVTLFDGALCFFF